MEGELKNIVIEIAADELNYGSSEKKHAYYRSKYPAIGEKYKVLIQKACEPNFEIEKFMWMIDMKNQIDDKKITTHDASVEVGKVLVDEYIAPKLNVQPSASNTQ